MQVPSVLNFNVWREISDLRNQLTFIKREIILVSRVFAFKNSYGGMNEARKARDKCNSTITEKITPVNIHNEVFTVILLCSQEGGY
jgi:hypothetical protein